MVNDTDKPTDPVTPTPPKAIPLRELCQKYGIRFKKGLGQNLLLDDNINAIMVEAAGLTPQDDVIEVGSGLGALTRPLCCQAGRLRAFPSLELVSVRHRQFPFSPQALTLRLRAARLRAGFLIDKTIGLVHT